MNNLAYTSQDSATVGPKVEEKVREDLGATVPIPYEVEGGDAQTTSLGTLASDFGSYFVGGKDNSLFILHFAIDKGRSVRLSANVTRYGRGCYVSLLVFSTTLSKPIAGAVALGDAKMFGKPKFGGDADLSAKLNANGPLMKATNDLARTEATVASGQIQIKRRCELVPHEGGTMLVLNTLPRMLKMGLSATTDAGQFLALADLVEGAL